MLDEFTYSFTYSLDSHNLKCRSYVRDGWRCSLTCFCNHEVQDNVFFECWRTPAFGISRRSPAIIYNCRSRFGRPPLSRRLSDSCLSDDQPLELTASLGSQVFDWPWLLGRDCPGGGLSVVALWVAGFWLRRTWLVLRAYRSGGDRLDRL